MYTKKVKKQAQRAWDLYDGRQVVLKQWEMDNRITLAGGVQPLGDPRPEEFPQPPFPDPRGPRPEDWRFFERYEWVDD